MTTCAVTGINSNFSRHTIFTPAQSAVQAPTESHTFLHSKASRGKFTPGDNCNCHICLYSRPPCDAGTPHAHEHPPLSYISHAFKTVHRAHGKSRTERRTNTHTHSMACSKSYLEEERGVWRREAEPHRWEPVHRSHQGRGAQRKRVRLDAKEKNPTRETSSPALHSATKSISHSLTSPSL